MSVLTKDGLIGLDVGFAGSSFCEAGTKTSVEFPGLDWGFAGSSFFGASAGGEAPPAVILNLNLATALQGVSSDIHLIQPNRIRLDSTLAGVTGALELLNTNFMQDIQVLFQIRTSGRDDISTLFDIIGGVLQDVAVEFSIGRAGSYNFQEMSVTFEITTGSKFSDISVLFSIVKSQYAYATYIFQKLYCTCEEIIEDHGADADLLDWNVRPNQIWYVKVNNGVVSLYETQADMVAGTNRIGYGTADASLRVVLEAEDEYESIAFFYIDYPYHLGVKALIAGDRYFKILPLTDLAEIRHPIYNNTNIALSRGPAELDLHTYSEIKKEITLGVHLPTVEVGDVIEYTSVRRNSTIMSQIRSQSISGTIGGNGEASLINTIQTATFTELVRK